MAMSRRDGVGFVAAMGNTEVGMKATGSSCSVPENPTAKLMYYLDCVMSLLKIGGIEAMKLRKLRDYENWHRLDSGETDELIILGAMLSPDTLLNKIIFIAPEMCGSTSNEFYELSAVRNRVVVTNNIVIGGKTQSVAKIMTVKEAWLKKNWIEPMEHFESRLRRMGNRRERERSCVIL